MRRASNVLVAIVATVAISGCGDLHYDDLPTDPATPPGSTAALGSISVLVDQEQVVAPLQTGAVYRNENFGFTGITAAGPVTRILSISVRLPGPGTYAVGGTSSPLVSYMEQHDGTTSYRWSTQGRVGAGELTVTFLSTESASGHFSFELEPDSATAAAGFTTRKFLTNGSFSVSMMR